MSSTSLMAKALKTMETVVEWAVTVIVAIMVVNISLGVFCRYVLNDALFWTEEMSRYLMIWAGMLGAGLAMKDDGHVGLNFFVDIFPTKAKWVFRFLSRLVVTVFLAILLIKSFDYLRTLSIQKSAAMELPMVIPYLSVTLGAILMSIENLVLMARLFVKAEAPTTEGRKE
ncbi:MAG: TRAP transporter small permease [Spirochaetes bacterium]|nr:TRAP transporter small permease [Spirochaetota bacterium]